MSFHIPDEFQGIFNIVCIHLNQQGRKSMDGDACLYRNIDGDRCAVGCLIPDSEYDPDMETNTVGYLVDNEHLTCSNKMLYFLEHLQQAHDMATVYRDIKRELINIANRYELNSELLESLPFTPKE